MKAAMQAGIACALHPWSAADFALTFAMWAVMMVGMMVPSAAPMSLLFAAVARKARGAGLRGGADLRLRRRLRRRLDALQRGATAAQWGLERAALLSPMLASTSPAFGGALLAAAGLYQWTPVEGRLPRPLPRAGALLRRALARRRARGASAWAPRTGSTASAAAGC